MTADCPASSVRKLAPPPPPSDTSPQVLSLIAFSSFVSIIYLGAFEIYDILGTRSGTHVLDRALEAALHLADECLAFVSEFPPDLLSAVLGINVTQEGQRQHVAPVGADCRLEHIPIDTGYAPDTLG